MPEPADTKPKIAFQGVPGAYSHQACVEVEPGLDPLPCPSFEDVITAVRNGDADRAMLPVENSVYGRVADIHNLLPESELYIIAEHFLPIRLQLLGIKGAALDQVKHAHSHTVALGQCRKFLSKHGIAPAPSSDTAGSAQSVAEHGDPTHAAIASTLAGEIYQLEELASNIEDANHNTTRFLVMSRQKIEADRTAGQAMTSFVFSVRNVPAALYKALGGFATNNINMVKLESYMVGGEFHATQFYADIEGHPEDQSVKWAFEELNFFCSYMKILGVYPIHPFRRKMSS